MRSRHAESARAQCQACIEAVLEAHDLGPTGEVQADTEGWVNLTYFIDDRLVMRFNARDPHLPKFQREAQAYALARHAGIAVPELLVLDTSRTIAPFDVMITSRIEGQNIERLWPELDAHSRHDYGLQAGELLARLHAIELDHAGELGADDSRHWGAIALELALGELETGVGLGLWDASQRQRFEEALRAGCHALGTVEPVLCHGDYGVGNLLARDGRIVAVLDFEWALGGDAVLDLLLDSEIEDFTPGITASLREGYGPFDEQALVARQPLYRCWGGLVLAAVAGEHFDASEASVYRQRAWRRLVDDLEPAL